MADHLDMTPTGPPRAGHAKVEVRAATRRFRTPGGGDVHALGPIDLEIGDGEFVCIVGPSGCGKSTLLRLIAGLLRPSAGEVEIRTTRDPRSSVAMVFQAYGIFPWKSVERNVSFGLEVNGVRRREAVARASAWIEKLGLAEFATAYPRTLSGGMSQRVSIARALAVEPEVLLMDEPFAALDAQLRQVLQEELLQIWQADRRTVLFITHSLEEALILGDRVLVMSSRPGTILESVEVPFARPRTPALRAASEFSEMRERLWALLRSQIDPGVGHPGVGNAGGEEAR